MRNRGLAIELSIAEEMDVNLDCDNDTVPIDMETGMPIITGSTVIPNPEDEPTDDLETVKINTDTFRIKDPQLSDWARGETKPDYSPEEVGAVNRDNPITTDTINRFVNAVFGI